MGVSCSKCGRGRFELSSVSAGGSAQPFTVLHCADCGQSLGISEIEPMRATLREQQSALDHLRRQLDEVREKLASLAPPG